MEVVFDSSTLILLAKTEILRIVCEDCHAIIPELVMKECACKDIFDAKLISSLIEDGKLKVIKVSKGKIINKLCKDFNIHEGEAEALSLALERKNPLAVDDLPTIKACRVVNQDFTTAIHFLINIAETGKIDGQTAAVKLEKLAFYGRYSRRIIDNAAIRLKGGL